VGFADVAAVDRQAERVYLAIASSGIDRE
jgi:hypothetical protein